MAEGSCAHQHGHTAAENRRRLIIVLILTGFYLIAEVVGGLLTNSLALLSDAGHMLTDVGALLVALVALWFASRPATPHKSYGYYRLEILAALLNGIVLLGVSVFIVVEAIRRMNDPPVVGGWGLLLVATGGLIVNIIGAVVLHGGHSHSLNVRAAYFHVIGDALGSVGAMASGILILTVGWRMADPIMAIIIAVLVVISAVALIREAIDVLLEATPGHIDTDELRAAVLGVTGVTEIHDLHIWTITSGMHALSCHVVVAEEHFTIAKLEEIRAILHDDYGISHQTIQIETCELTDEEDIHL